MAGRPSRPMSHHGYHTTIRISAALACCLATCVLTLVFGADAMAAAPECERVLNKAAVDAVTPDGETRRRVQDGLITVYENDPDFEAARRTGPHGSEGRDFAADSVIGHDTRQWLHRFCVDYRVDGGPRVVENVVESVVGYARIAERHPRWKAIIARAEFAAWIGSRDAAEHYDVYDLRRSGAAPIIIGLLDEYAARPPLPPQPPVEPPISPSTPEPCPPATATGSAVYYRLSATDLETLAAVQGLKAKHFENGIALAAAAREAAGPGAHSCIQDRVVAAVEASAGKSATRHVLTQASFDALIRMNLPREIRDALAELQGQAFETDKALRNAVRVRVEAVAQGKAASEQHEGATAEKQGNETPLATRSEQPDRAAGAVVEKVMAQARKVTGYEVGADPSQALRDQPEFMELSEQALATLTALQDVAHINERLYRAAVVAILKPLRDAGDPMELTARAVAWQARKQARRDDAPLTVSGGGCGCVRSFGDKTIYGFYPFWITDLPPAAGRSEQPGEAAPEGQESAPFEVNFSLLDRIAYYALDLNEQGRIPDRRQWHGGRGARTFITTAHRYGTEVDLAVRAGGWQGWGDDRLASAVESVVARLVPQAPFRASFQPSARRFQDAFLATSPDGIVLHFPGYPHATEKERARIVTFVRRLREALRQLEGGDTFSVSLALDLLGADKQRRGLAALRHLLVSAGEGARELVDHVIIFLEQPTTDSKKQLRQAVEDEFKGKERVQVLRKIVPLIPPNGHRRQPPNPYQQLDDDLRYFDDNFGGVAWWPLSGSAAEADRRALEKLVRAVFVEKTAEVDFLQRQVKRFLPALCDVVCPNRVGFRMAMGLVLAVVLVALLVAFFGCGLACLVAARPWVSVAVLVVLVALLLALLMCDPVWKSHSTDIIGGLLAVTVLSMLLRFWFRLKQGPLP